MFRNWTVPNSAKFALGKLVLLGLLVFAVGCSKDNPLGRCALSGSVSLDGQPLAHGNIEFAPSSESGVSSGSIVQEGRFEIPELRGLPPGKYRVRVFASQVGSVPRTPEEAALPAAHRPGVERVAAEFNTASKLKIEVQGGDSNEFDIRVMSSAK